jgi:hypothetical protein
MKATLVRWSALFLLMAIPDLWWRVEARLAAARKLTSLPRTSISSSSRAPSVASSDGGNPRTTDSHPRNASHRLIRRLCPRAAAGVGPQLIPGQATCRSRMTVPTPQANPMLPACDSHLRPCSATRTTPVGPMTEARRTCGRTLLERLHREATQAGDRGFAGLPSARPCADASPCT